MAASFEQISAEALTLSPTERELLADLLWRSVDPQEDEPLSPAWEAEIARRIKEIDDGVVKPIPMEEFFEKMRRRFGA